MLGKFLNNQRGFTFLELLIVIVITVVITSVFVVSTRQTPVDDVQSSSQQLLSDFRYTRGLATSKAVYDFDGGGPETATYPSGGYGIYFTDNEYQYYIFADKGPTAGYNLAEGDQVIKSVALENTTLDLEDFNQPQPAVTTKYFTFKSADEVNTNFISDANGQFKMSVNYNPGVGLEGYKGIITLGKLANDGSVFVSLGLGAEDWIPLCSAEGAGCDASQPCCTGFQCNPTTRVCQTPVTNPPPTNQSCFPAGTKVLMADSSYKNIEDVEVGDFVLSYDEASGQKVSAQVLDLAAPLREHMCEIIFADNDSLKLTNEHPVYTSEGWKSINPSRTDQENEVIEVSQLDLGNQVLFVDGQYKEVAEINCWQEIIQTYNLKVVDGTYTFFADDVVVHNAAAPECSTDPAEINRGTAGAGV